MNQLCFFLPDHGGAPISTPGGADRQPGGNGWKQKASFKSWSREMNLITGKYIANALELLQSCTKPSV